MLLMQWDAQKGWQTLARLGQQPQAFALGTARFTLSAAPLGAMLCVEPGSGTIYAEALGDGLPAPLGAYISAGESVFRVEPVGATRWAPERAMPWQCQGSVAPLAEVALVQMAPAASAGSRFYVGPEPLHLGTLFAHIPLPPSDPQAASFHATIRASGPGELWVRDAGKGPGTFVAVSGVAQLQAGTRICTEGLTLSLLAEEDAPHA